MDMAILFSTITFLIFTAILCRNFLFSKTKLGQMHLPPSPMRLPIIGHLHLLNNTPHSSFHNLCKLYGPLIHLRLGSEICIIASTPETAKECLITNGLTFASRPVNIVIDLLTYDSAGFGFAPYGTYWQFMKKIVTTELLGERTLTQLQRLRADEASELISILLNKANSGKVVNLSEEVAKVSNNIISRMMLGFRCSGEDEWGKGIRSVVREATEIIATFNLSDFIWFLRHIDVQGIKKRAMNIQFRFDTLLEKIIKEREQVRRKKVEKSSKDFLDMLLDLSEDESSKIKLTRANIKAFMFDFLTAATDTSGIVVEWAMSELVNNPAVMEKAKEEIDSVVGKNRLVKESDIANLPYLQAIFKETLRLHPPIPIFERESTEDCKVAGYDIPAKSILFINNWSICRDPKTWKNPFKFQPERFMSQGPGNENASMVDVRGQHFNILPFGSGRRGCPGVALAVQVVPTVLALLIQGFDWSIPSNGNEVAPKVVDMSERPGLTVPKAKPLMLVPSIRLNPFPMSI